MKQLMCVAEQNNAGVSEAERADEDPNLVLLQSEMKC